MQKKKHTYKLKNLVRKRSERLELDLLFKKVQTNMWGIVKCQAPVWNFFLSELETIKTVHNYRFKHVDGKMKPEEQPLAL